MNTPLSKFSSFGYQKIAKPILFKFRPDGVHDNMLKAGMVMQKSRLVTWAMQKVLAYQNPAKLGQKLHGITFKNPIGLSAGFDKNLELPPMLRAVGFGFMEGGSLTSEPCVGNPRPWFHRLPKTKSIVVYAGLANQGVERIIQRIKSYPKSLFSDFPLNISVAKANSAKVCTESEGIADYVASLKAIKRAKVGHIITLNISCPNTYGGEPFTTPVKLGKLLGSVDKVGLKQPVFVKMPCNLPWTEFKKLLDVCAEHKVAGVTISNLSKDRGQAKLLDPLPDSIQGNLSGKPTWELSNSLIAKTYLEYGERFTIIGVGGVFSAEDAYTKIKLGASLVELITGLIFEGPSLIGQINQGLVKLLNQDGYKNIHEAVGSAHK